MSFEGLEHLPEVSAGDWIAPRLRGFGGRVHCIVPDGFGAYARILHPAYDEDGHPVTWAEVCRSTGRVAHPLMQWDRVAGVTRNTFLEGRWPRRREVSRETAEWPGSEPMTGDLPSETLSAVLEVLAGVTAGEADCCHAIWDGWGWLHPGAWGFLTASDNSSRAPTPLGPAGLDQEMMAGPMLRLPGRDYLLFRGPLRAALRTGHQVTADWFSPQSPSLLWPRDRSWCLATEIDFDSTLVGGSPELIDAILRAPGLDAWPVEPTDDLTIGGDTVNR